MNTKKILIRTFQTLTLLFIFFNISALISAAGPIDDFYTCQPLITVTWDEEKVNEPISPYSEPITIPIKIKMRITGVLQDIILTTGPAAYGDKKYIVRISIVEAPDWSNVIINPPLVNIPVDKDWVSANATVTLTLNKNSPAFERSKIKIGINSKPLGGGATIILPANETLEIPFTVGYVPIIAINELEGNSKLITPNEVANFPIEILNLGNGKTDIKTEIISIPEGWFVDTTSDISLGVEYLGDNYKQTLNFAIKPPNNFGYHEEREVIEVSITPYSNKDYNISGESHLVSFVVHSRGFSTPGFEGFLAVLSIFLSVFIIKYHKSQKSNNYLSKRGEKHDEN